MRKKNLTNLLAIVAGLLALAVGGLFFYMHQQALHFEVKCHEDEQMVMEIKSLMDEIKDLPVDKESESFKEWLKKLDMAKSNLENMSEALQTAKPGSKYQEVRVGLLDAAKLERELLDDVEDVVKDPLARDVSHKAENVEVKAVALHDMAKAVEIGQTNFAVAMDLCTVKDCLTAYVAVAKKEDERRQEEEARKARERTLHEARNGVIWVGNRTVITKSIHYNSGIYSVAIGGLKGAPAFVQLTKIDGTWKYRDAVTEGAWKDANGMEDIIDVVLQNCKYN